MTHLATSSQNYFLTKPSKKSIIYFFFSSEEMLWFSCIFCYSKQSSGFWYAPAQIKIEAWTTSTM